MKDLLPEMVRNFVRRGLDAQSLLDETRRHVGAVARPYPDAWFELGHKGPEAVEDLTDRVFTTCARVPKGRFPFLGRAPFLSYVEDGAAGTAIRYHSFYAKISITRELLRDSYRANLRRDPTLRQRALLYARIGAVLREIAEPVSQGPRRPPLWQLPSAGLRTLLSWDDAVRLLRATGRQDSETLVRLALQRVGPLSQASLTALLEELLAPPPLPPEPEQPTADLALRTAVRGAVLAAWTGLAPEERELLLALSRGLSFDEIIELYPRYRHRVAITRALERCNRQFLRVIAARVGVEGAPSLPPLALAELVTEVLLETGSLPRSAVEQEVGVTPAARQA